MKILKIMKLTCRMKVHNNDPSVGQKTNSNRSRLSGTDNGAIVVFINKFLEKDAKCHGNYQVHNTVSLESSLNLNILNLNQNNIACYKSLTK